MKRVVIGLTGGYLTVAAMGLAAERMGAARCGCAADCWCHKPLLGAFRWAMPIGHRGNFCEQKRGLAVRT